MKAIYKFNNDQGVTICHSFYGAINLGCSDKLYCNKCKGYNLKTKKNNQDKTLKS